MKVDYIVVHCTAGRESATLTDVRRYHIQSRGWSDIGYHLLIEADGTVRVGRRLDIPGAHVRGLNDRSLGVSMTGLYDDGQPSPGQMDATIRVVADLCKSYGLESDAVIGHREAYAILGQRAAKTCPGTAIDLGAFRSSVGATIKHRRAALARTANT